MKKQLTMGLVSVMMVASSLSGVQAKSTAQLMDAFVSAYKKGNYKKAKAASNKMKKVVEEPCAYKMSKPMKKAYKAVVQSYINRYSDDWNYDHNDNNSQTTRVDGYALSDVDGDGKAELFVVTMDLFARPSTVYNVYTFKNNKAVRIGKNMEMLDGSLHAYPNKKGIYFFAQDHGVLQLSKGVIKKGRFKWQTIKSPAEDGGNPKLYDLFMHELSLYAYLPGHFEKNHVDLSLFK